MTRYEPFSWQRLRNNVLKRQIRQTRRQALLGTGDIKLEHPDWHRDAQTGNYALLDKAVKERQDKQIDKAEFKKFQALGKEEEFVPRYQPKK